MWDQKHKLFVTATNGQIPRYSITKFALRSLLEKYGYNGPMVDPDLELRAQKLRRIL